MSKIVALASGATALNLALTGISIQEVEDSETAESMCSALMDDSVDVLIVEEKLREGFSRRMTLRLAEHTGRPLIVNCPSFDEEDSDVDAYLSSVIKPAVGFEIRLA